MSLNVGIFSGSFNPVHIGHLALANYLCEFEGLDEIWFLVTPQNPQKEESNYYSDEQRLSWVRKAIAGYPKFKASDFEWNLSKPYYTINTLRSLKATYPSIDFTLVIGSDNWCIFDKWKDYDKILKEFSVLVYPRKGYESEGQLNKVSTVRFSSAPLIEVSSTFIRENVRQGKDLRFLVPEGIYQEL